MKRLPLALLAVVLLSASTLHAQYSVGSSSCGAASTALVSCHSLPISLGGVPQGTAWLNAQLSPTTTSPSFIIWQEGLGLLPQANIGKVVCTTTEKVTSGTHTAMQCTFMTVYFSGGDLADSTYYTGEGTFYFRYDFTGYGIAARWNRTETKGAVRLVFY